MYALARGRGHERAYVCSVRSYLMARCGRDPLQNIIRARINTVVMAPRSTMMSIDSQIIYINISGIKVQQNPICAPQTEITKNQKCLELGSDT